jgi:hypothetical protein
MQVALSIPEAGPAPRLSTGWKVVGGGGVRGKQMFLPSFCSDTSTQFIEPSKENSTEQNPRVACTEFLSTGGLHGLFEKL